MAKKTQVPQASGFTEIHFSQFWVPEDRDQAVDEADFLRPLSWAGR